MRRPFGAGLVQGVCCVNGCINLQRLKGITKNGRYYDKLCNYHHRMKYQIPQCPTDHNSIPNDRCVICGWDKGPCDRHRIEPKEGYKPTNVRVLCPNCHRLVTLGRITL